MWTENEVFVKIEKLKKKIGRVVGGGGGGLVGSGVGFWGSGWM